VLYLISEKFGSNIAIYHWNSFIKSSQVLLSHTPCFATEINMFSRALLHAEASKCVLTFFTKPNCSLCVPAKEILANIQMKIPSAELKIVDISKDAHWFAQYQYDIPVLHLNGKEISRHRFDESKIMNLINSEPNN